MKDDSSLRSCVRPLLDFCSAFLKISTLNVFRPEALSSVLHDVLYVHIAPYAVSPDKYKKQTNK